jgi:hypothetical protein
MRPVSFFVCSSYDKEKKVSVLYICNTIKYIFLRFICKHHK